MKRSSSGTDHYDYNHDGNTDTSPVSAGSTLHVDIPSGAPDITPTAAYALLRLLVAVHQKRCSDSTDRPEAT
jgi:hypothetical protein